MGRFVDEDEETPQEPIAGFLGTFSPFLKSVQQQTSPKGFYGPGIIAQIAGQLTGKDPQAVYDASVPQLETAADIGMSMALPGASLPARLGAAALPPMLLHALSGQGMSNPGTGLLKGGIGTASQGVMETILGPVKQFFPRIGKRAMADKAYDRYGRELDQYAEDIAAHNFTTGALKEQDKVQKQVADQAYQIYKQGVDAQNAAALKKARLQYKTEGLQLKADAKAANDAATRAFQQSTESFTDQAARTIMDDVKARVSWLSDLTSNVKGVIDLVLGKGQQIISQYYDDAMTAALETAKGRKIEISPMDARKLQIPIEGIVERSALNPKAADMALVDAADTIKAITNTSKGRDWGMYRRIVGELEKHELGIDPAAREMYKTALGTIESIDKSGAIAQVGGHLTLDTQKLLDGVSSVKGIDILRKRGLGDINDATIATAAVGTPQPPVKVSPQPQMPFVAPTPTPVQPQPIRKPIQMPDEPVMPLSPQETGEVAVKELPGNRFSRAGSLGTGLGALGFYLGGWGGAREAAGLGTALGLMTPNQWVTKAPMTEGLESILNTISQGAGGVIRQPPIHYLSPQTPATGIQQAADMAARLKALEDEGLNMTPDPE